MTIPRSLPAALALAVLLAVAPGRVQASSLELDVFSGHGSATVSKPDSTEATVSGNADGLVEGLRLGVQRGRLGLRVGVSHQESSGPTWRLRIDPSRPRSGRERWDLDVTAGWTVLQRGRFSLEPHAGATYQIERTTDAEEFARTLSRVTNNRILATVGTSARIRLGARTYLRPDLTLRLQGDDRQEWEATIGFGWRFGAPFTKGRDPSESNTSAP